MNRKFQPYFNVSIIPRYTIQFLLDGVYGNNNQHVRGTWFVGGQLIQRLRYGEMIEDLPILVDYEKGFFFTYWGGGLSFNEPVAENRIYTPYWITFKTGE